MIPCNFFCIHFLVSKTINDYHFRNFNLYPIVKPIQVVPAVDVSLIERFASYFYQLLNWIFLPYLFFIFLFFLLIDFFNFISFCFLYFFSFFALYICSRQNFLSVWRPNIGVKIRIDGDSRKNWSNYFSLHFHLYNRFLPFF